MGGTALGFESARISDVEYEKLSDTMGQFFFHNCINASIIPSYFNKKSFGDMDIIYTGITTDRLQELIVGYHEGSP